VVCKVAIVPNLGIINECTAFGARRHHASTCVLEAFDNCLSDRDVIQSVSSFYLNSALNRCTYRFSTSIVANDEGQWSIELDDLGPVWIERVLSIEYCQCS
jgi:hypothetical protein